VQRMVPLLGLRSAGHVLTANKTHKILFKLVEVGHVFRVSSDIKIGNVFLIQTCMCSLEGVTLIVTHNSCVRYK